ncbi:EF-hand calcium-binding domain-containing protein 12 isoform X2 [Ornithorhynchus anatinus]|uniref:EF-hand calcium binding domain 12 n=1 Tax=Ornithorhynchus anatinus TaxID=9258 RepID=K7E718_ORNAN|nr:EF-hand calcium-binding domain-containing protein 12 isoform X2 [Ornithorhynchus anatinus]
MPNYTNRCTLRSADHSVRWTSCRRPVKGSGKGDQSPLLLVNPKATPLKFPNRSDPSIRRRFLNEDFTLSTVLLRLEAPTRESGPSPAPKESFRNPICSRNQDSIDGSISGSPTLSSDDSCEDVQAKPPQFNPELRTRHCFKQFRRQSCSPTPWNSDNQKLSRRRVIVAPTMVKISGDLEADNRVVLPELKSYSTHSQRTVERERDDDLHNWLSQRQKIQKELDFSLDLEKWVCTKPTSSRLEAKVAKRIQCRREAELAAAAATRKLPRKRRVIPKLKLPEPEVLSRLHAYLYKHNTTLAEVFTKGGGARWKISRREFITELKEIHAPVTDKDLEDLVIYLSSLNRRTEINTANMEISFRDWLSSFQLRSALLENRRRYRYISPVKKKPSRKLPRKLMYLEVPSFPIETERMPLTYEDMEEVGRLYRERRRKAKRKVNPLLYAERCRLVRSRIKIFDDNCIPSTLREEMGEWTNVYRQKCFLTYLQSVTRCRKYNISLTETVLSKALLYPGDKIIEEKGFMRKIRQPWESFSDLWTIRPSPVLEKEEEAEIPESPEEMFFQDSFDWSNFEEVDVPISQLKEESYTSEDNATHPNFFWPGHLLDKLRLYLPTQGRERENPLFSWIHQTPPVYPAAYQPIDRWPINYQGYMTYGNYNPKKTYLI